MVKLNVNRVRTYDFAEIFLVGSDVYRDQHGVAWCCGSVARLYRKITGRSGRVPYKIRFEVSTRRIRGGVRVDRCDSDHRWDLDDMNFGLSRRQREFMEIWPWHTKHLWVRVVW